MTVNTLFGQSPFHFPTANPALYQAGNAAGYEIAPNYNGVAFVPMPRAASEIKNGAKFQLLAVTESKARANYCRHLAIERRGHWELGPCGIEELAKLVFEMAPGSAR